MSCLAVLTVRRWRLAFHNKAAIYGLLFNASAQTLLTIAADPRHLGARIGMTSVLHSWDSAMAHHPHVHVIVPGGGLSPDGARWIACRPGFFLPVKVLSRLFRRLFLEGLVELHRAGKLSFFGGLSGLADPDAFAAHLAPLRKADWVVYAKPPFGGPRPLGLDTHGPATASLQGVRADLLHGDRDGGGPHPTAGEAAAGLVGHAGAVSELLPATRRTARGRQDDHLAVAAGDPRSPPRHRRRSPRRHRRGRRDLSAREPQGLARMSQARARPRAPPSPATPALAGFPEARPAADHRPVKGAHPDPDPDRPRRGAQRRTPPRQARREPHRRARTPHPTGRRSLLGRRRRLSRVRPGAWHAALPHQRQARTKGHPRLRLQVPNLHRPPLRHHTSLSSP